MSYRNRIVNSLDFVSENAGGLRLWASCDEAQHWAVQCQIGRERAEKLISFMSENQDPSLLGRVVQHMVECGKFGGVETGFFQAISTAMIA